MRDFPLVTVIFGASTLISGAILDSMLMCLLGIALSTIAIISSSNKKE